ncbi:hypothetical protein GCM10023194_05340 [Planotetraspora phitsanulokensis]|uniref:Uncharacterized protein n=1 Tax=Planotetraspora phitsanulokensis TaxID=575192 RepID=A0A8J3UHQ3_9ACTN|nr:hypothetical protein Pph01_40330 [Planotetraspora phitsanulokensis]
MSGGDEYEPLLDPPGRPQEVDAVVTDAVAGVGELHRNGFRAKDREVRAIHNLTVAMDFYRQQELDRSESSRVTDWLMPSHAFKMRVELTATLTATSAARDTRWAP